MPIINQTGGYAASSSSHSLSRPSGYQAGDRIYYFVVFETGTSVSDWDAADNSVGNWYDDAPRNWDCFVRYEDISGGESGTVDITLGAARTMVYRSFLVRGYTGSPDAQPSTGEQADSSGTSKDPPSITPSGGLGNYLIFAAVCYANGATSVSGNPSTYTDGGNEGQSGSAGIGVAYKELSSITSEDPGAFTLSSAEEGIGMTVAQEMTAGISDLAIDLPAMADGWVPLSWTADGSQAEVHRKQQAGSFTPDATTKIADIGASDTDYTDNAANSTSAPLHDVNYTYVITDNSYNELSNFVQQKMPPPRPTGLIVDDVQTDEVTITATQQSSSTRNRLIWQWRTSGSGPYSTLGTFGSLEDQQTYVGLSVGTSYDFRVASYSTTTELQSGWTEVTQATIGNVGGTDGITLGDSAAVSVGTLVEVDGVDGLVLGDSAALSLVSTVFGLEGLILGDSAQEQGVYGLSQLKLGDQASILITYAAEAPQIVDVSGWDRRAGLAYPPNVEPQLEPWMERVRVTLEDLIDESFGDPDILYLSTYILETGEVYANVKCNVDTVAVKYLFDTSQYPTAAQTHTAGATHVITDLGETFELGALSPVLVPGDTGYLTIVGYKSVTSGNEPSGNYSAAAMSAVTYEMGQGGNDQDLAPIFYWNTQESGGTGTIYLTVTDPQGANLTTRFWTKVGSGNSWVGPTVDSAVVSGTTKTHSVNLTTGHNSYIRFTVENAAGYQVGGTAVFDPDEIPDTLVVSLDIDTSGVVTAKWQGDTDTQSVKIAASTSGYPTKATTQGTTAQNGQSGSWSGTLANLDPGQTCYVSALAYSELGGGGNELPEIFRVSILFPDAAAVGAAKEITYSATAPGSPELNDLWVETDVDPFVLWRWSGSTWRDIGLLDQGTFATLDEINDGNVSSVMVVSQLSAITADVGLLTAGLIQNAAGTNYIDLNATLTDKFISAGSDFYVQANGTAYFGGTVGSDTFTATNASFGSTPKVALRTGIGGARVRLNTLGNYVELAGVYDGSDDKLSITSALVSIASFAESQSIISNKLRLGTNIAGGNEIVRFENSINSNYMHIRFESTETRLIFVPNPSGSNDFTKEFWFNFAATPDHWGFDARLDVNASNTGSASDHEGVLFVGNRTGDPATPSGGVYVYAKGGELYVKDSSGNVYILSPPV